MPRRRPRPEDVLEGETPILMLPAAAPRTGHRHERERDPYETPPGAVPGKISNLRPGGSKPIERELTPKDLAERSARKAEATALGNRYRRYLDAMVKYGGERAHAIAEVMGLPLEAVQEQIFELHAEICRGVGHTELGDILVENDLGLNARVSRLRDWVYSDVAAASLSALKIVGDLDGTSGDDGSFEQYLRLAKERERMPGAKK